MNKKTLFAASILAVIGASNASAHLEPKKGDNLEKCFGVVKAGKNDCASKASKHSCAAMGKIDGNPNEWIKVPKGLCNKLVGGKVASRTNHDDGHSNHNDDD